LQRIPVSDDCLWRKASVELAMALRKKPRVLLLDETAGGPF